ncbi:purine-cytosine permease family protein [Brevibacterium aurantiacum]|uniref:purine-cytosine permease family protein n=1 Tax=Brevibacterium aurantiacum TaxID=273384 RepID=UPI001865E6EF|nr:cytosine permease [Brevibacterium aurantiacum]
MTDLNDKEGIQMSTRTQETGLETRSIDFIPEQERHGKVWHLGPMWFAVNANLTILATGVFGLMYGANLFWSFVAALLGVSVGTFFMAFHSAQGPQLGMPQMLQSRAQFGYRGALIVVPGVLVMYLGYNIVNTQLAAEATNVIVDQVVGQSVNAELLYVLMLALVFVVALVGYTLIHAIQRVLTVLFLMVFGVLTVGAVLIVDLPEGSFDPGSGFVWLAFLAQFSVAAASQMGWAPYVADYSRYLPSKVGVRATFWWTYLGSMTGAIWMMWLGALTTAAAGVDTGPVVAVREAAEGIFPGFGIPVMLVAVPGLLSVTVVNTYCAGLTLITVMDSIKPLRPTLRHRVFVILLVVTVVFLGATYGSSNFLEMFQNLILIMLYCFVPWTAINLLDFYTVRRGEYEISEMFKPAGIYGQWNWRGLVAYVASLTAMVPFFSIGEWFTGPIAESIGGIDIAMFIGLPVSGILYLVFNRYWPAAGVRQKKGKPGAKAGDGFLADQGV